MGLRGFSALGTLVDRMAPGRRPQFAEAHMVKALKIIREEGPGRKHLASRLGLGEGVVRTLLGRLMDAGLVVTDRSGTGLTEAGQRLISEITRTIPGMPVLVNDLTVAGCNYMVLIRGGACRVRYGVEQRDAALIAGARGATTLLFSDGELHAPGLDRRVGPELIRDIMELGPTEGDAIVLGSADTALGAEIGAYSAALTLLVP